MRKDITETESNEWQDNVDQNLIENLQNAMSAILNSA